MELLEPGLPSSPPERPPAFVRNLERLPSILVRQVIEDLPKVRVLQILVSGSQSLRDCVFAHWQISNSPDTNVILDLFKLYHDITHFKNRELSPHSGSFSTVYPNRPSQTENVLDTLRWDMGERIIDGLSLNPDVAESILSIFSTTTPCPNVNYGNLLSKYYPIRRNNVSLNEKDISDLKARWEWIKTNTLRMNAAKSAQLEEVARIIAENPVKLRVKKPLDPSQDPRENVQHLIDHFNIAAKKMLKNRTVPERGRRCYRGIENIEIIPYDRHLWFFLTTIKDFPHDDRQVIEVDKSMRDAVGQQSSTPVALKGQPRLLKSISDATVKVFQYPEEIASSISVVMNGLVNIYTGSPLLIVPRIDWTSDPKKPVFFVDTEPHPYAVPKHIHRCLAARVLPYDPREYEWLKAFLKVVTWMEENFSNKEL